jgi:hypothetical protein
VKTPAAGLTQLASLTRQAYEGAVTAHTEYLAARALAARLERSSDAKAAAAKAELDSIAPPPATGRRRGFGGFGGPGGAGVAPAPTLESVSNALMAAAMAMQGADVTPTAGQAAGVTKALAEMRAVMQKWSAIKALKLAASEQNPPPRAAVGSGTTTP